MPLYPAPDLATALTEWLQWHGHDPGTVREVRIIPTDHGTSVVVEHRLTLTHL